MTDQSPILTSERVFLPANPRSTNEHIHVYFITGNPGCIAYYHPFLTTLQAALRPDGGVLRTSENEPLRQTAQQWSWTFHGRSLGGMVAADGIRSLQEQISLVEEDLLQSVSTSRGTKKGTRKVVLMGHSVGAYIAMEVLRRIRARGADLEIEIIGLVGLFPTITDIALSPRGVIATPVLTYGLPLITPIFNGLLWPWSPKYLRPIVQFVTGMDEQPAKVTTEFLLSPTGVTQALAMAGDEMREIKSDRWDEDIWGFATVKPSGQRPATLAFLFGERDHWVRDAIRDDLIKARGRGEVGEEWKADMFVDRSGIPHAFCLKHNLQTAKLAVPLLLRLVEKHSSS